jgi:predicted SprT family Zn-dependent metalloprotease
MKKVKEELLRECYAQLNKHAFDNKLPADMQIKWSSRLRSTGGYCKNSVDKFSGERSCEIHVSSKVCDSAERMRDTLAHEMCHAAAFLINGVRDGHGPIWKSWANRVNFTFKKIPKITVTHSYFVTKKYIFRCQKCKQESVILL